MISRSSKDLLLSAISHTLLISIDSFVLISLPLFPTLFIQSKPYCTFIVIATHWPQFLNSYFMILLLFSTLSLYAMYIIDCIYIHVNIELVPMAARANKKLYGPTRNSIQVFLSFPLERSASKIELTTPLPPTTPFLHIWLGT